MTSSPVSFPTSPARLSSRLKRNYIPLLGVFLAIANSFLAALLCRLSLCCKSVVTQHKDNFAETSPADTSTSHFLLVHAALLLPHSLYSRIIAVFFFLFFFNTLLGTVYTISEHRSRLLLLVRPVASLLSKPDVWSNRRSFWRNWTRI